jgi:Co/Zn/Cd efflux system component
MHRDQPEKWRHEHNYISATVQRGERNTRRVIALTATMMVVEIVAGSVFNSMALLADGWHMASHASALSITAFAYFYARQCDPSE